MTVFVILSTTQDPELERKIDSVFPAENVKRLTSNQWLIAAEETTKSISDRIGKINHIVLSIGNYYGRSSPDVWEWLKIKMETN